jgi:hypothetical protein
MQQLLLLRYNVYYNRILRKKRTVDEYLPYAIPPAPGFENPTNQLNFNPNDHVYTTHVINWEGEIPDYLLVLDWITKEIQGRWYVIDAKRNRANQWTLSLYRDLLADYLDEVASSTVFVEKAMLSAQDPMLYNRENMTVNQIRQSATKLADDTGIPWVVGYIPEDSFEEAATITKSTASPETPTVTVSGIESWPLYEYVYEEDPGFEAPLVANAIMGVTFGLDVHSLLRPNHQVLLRSDRVSLTGAVDDVGVEYYNLYGDVGVTDEEIVSALAASFNSSASTSFWAELRSGYGAEKLPLADDILAANNAVIQDQTTGVIYRAKVRKNTGTDKGQIGTLGLSSAFEGLLPPAIGGNDRRVVRSDKIYYTAYATRAWIELVQISEQVKTTVAAAADRVHLTDSPYDMFCAPYGEVHLVPDSETGTYKVSVSTAAVDIAQGIATTVGSDNVYDIQILPYCPIPGLVRDGKIYLDKVACSPVYRTKAGSEIQELVSAVFWCSTSKFIVDIPLEIPALEDAIERKTTSETKLYRLVSPNYSSFFDFDPQKNDGVDGLRAYCSYRPYNPFIRVAPIFKGLYGAGDLQYDARGLIMAGDYSVAQVTAAWADYQMRNKNYQAVFDRQIQNIEVHQNAQRFGDITGALGGVLQGAASGAMAGGVYGAIAGAALSTVGAGVDYAVKEGLRNEAIDYTKDQFGYALGNVQALPQGIAKTDVQSVDNPLIPLLEVFDCTDVEREAYRNKLRYNGMTVMRVGRAGDYMDGGYFKARLIRMETAREDHHVVNTIASELNKGVYCYAAEFI